MRDLSSLRTLATQAHRLAKSFRFHADQCDGHRRAMLIHRSADCQSEADRINTYTNRECSQWAAQ